MRNSIAFLLTLCLILPAFSLNPLTSAENNSQTVEFRPFYEPYGSGSVTIFPDVNTSSITRGWNLEGWNISTMYWIIRFLVPLSWVTAGGGSHLDPGFDFYMYLSNDNGTTYPSVLYWDIGTTIYTQDRVWTGGFAYCDVARDVYSANLTSFTPNTRIKLLFHRGYSTWIPQFWLANAYWGAVQKPVPPFDYVDAEGTFVQYWLKFYAANCTESNITFTGSYESFPYETTKEMIQNNAETVIDCFHPSGVINEVTGKVWGRETWNVLYSGQLGARSLIQTRSIINDTRYLVYPKRFIAYQFSKQLSDGSFYFILTDGDEHPWYNATTNMWYGYDKIDCFSALSISLAKDYWEATNDTAFIDGFWSKILKSKDFIISLVNTTSWIVRDGYHFNGTDYNLSEWSLLHDCVEVWDGLKDFAYLWRYMKGNTAEADYWDAYAGGIATGIRSKFWNETLDRYVGFVEVDSNLQDPTLVYNIITPIVYGLETNETRAISTMQQYLYWGKLSGRYYDKDWAADYNVYNEYSTMSGMIFEGLAKLNMTFSLSEMWMKEKIIEVSKFLFNNPIYPSMMLQNSEGWLDFVNLINYTWANEYARLVETNAWVTRGLLALVPVNSLFNFSTVEIAILNATIHTQETYWHTIEDDFKHATGMNWLEHIVAWTNWLKAEGLYVDWFDYLFLKLLWDRHNWVDPWWEIVDPPVDPVIIEVPDYVSMYSMFCIGLSGLFLMVFSPTWVAWKIRKSGADVSTVERIGYGMLLFCVGFGLFVMWLWS